MNICSTCQGAQSECQERLDANAEYRAHVNETLAGEGLEYAAGLTNKNLLWLLVEEIGLDALRAKVTRPLIEPPRRAVLRLLHRAPAAAGRDRRRAPARQATCEQVIDALGGTVVDYAGVAQVLRLPDHHDEQGGVAGAGRPPPRRRGRRGRRLPGHAMPALPPEPRPPAAAGRARSSGASSTCRSSTCRSSSASRSGLAPKELGLGRHVVRPSSVIDWSTSVVAAAAAD